MEAAADLSEGALSAGKELPAEGAMDCADLDRHSPAEHCLCQSPSHREIQGS